MDCEGEIVCDEFNYVEVWNVTTNWVYPGTNCDYTDGEILGICEKNYGKKTLV